MQYRTMPRSQDQISCLGFGCMRFPTDSSGNIEESTAFEMLNYAYQLGVNYFDTAWPYHNEQSEILIGKWLQQVDRDKVLLATKTPCWLIKSKDDFQKYLEKQLEKMQTDYIDYYLLHALNKGSWPAMQKLKVLDFMERAKADGLIRHIGFSFHDSYPVFKKITLAYEWDFCQIMLNYLDTHYQAGRNGYNLAVSRQMGVISMEPLRGGKLVSSLPPEVSRIWSLEKDRQTPLERALRWVWNLEGCQVLLSGMSSIDQVKENVRLADICMANTLSESQLKRYQQARREFIKRIPILCSECRYCLPCPAKVAIPYVIGTYNEAIMFNDRDRHKREYELFIPEPNRAGKCTNCGVCLTKCPQHIDIPKQMRLIRDYFSS